MKANHAFGKKGSMSRYMLLSIVLIIFLIITIVLVYAGAYSLIENMFLGNLK